MAIGSKRLVVGAHYGLRDWLGQRLTAVVMTAYTAYLLVALLLAGETGYVGWAGLFAPLWMKVATLIVLFALLYHAWIGVRDIFMDYLKPLWVRLAAQVLAVLWLLFCAVWSVQILWSV
jgi:succinate dehydrogenase / fumarate reductase membrane anchor subunit